LDSDRILFIAPIYRESESSYYSVLDEKDRHSRERQERIRRKFIGDASRSAHLEIANSTQPRLPRKAWRYNRVVGWIEFYSDRQTIKADLWLSKGKRPRTSFESVTVECKGKLADICLTHRIGNRKIRGEIASFLIALDAPENDSLKGLFVDKTLLLQQLEFLDVKGLIDRIEKGLADKVSCASGVKIR
jgi:hypothetical protein